MTRAVTQFLGTALQVHFQLLITHFINASADLSNNNNNLKQRKNSFDHLRFSSPLILQGAGKTFQAAWTTQSFGSASAGGDYFRLSG